VGRADRASLSRGAGVALALALAVPVALWETRVHAAPTAVGLWRGVSDPPSAGRLLIAAAAGALGAWILRRRPPAVRRPLLFLLLAAAPMVPLFTGRLLILLAVQGPVLVLVAAGTLTVAIARQAAASPAASRPLRSGALFAAAFLFYALLGSRIPGPAGPQGDEPHYLVMAQSLLSDGDLDLRDEFAHREYAPFFAGTLQPHTSPRSPAGRIYSVHTPGLAVLLLPAYALGGYVGARLFMSALAALTAVLVYRLARDASVVPAAAAAAWTVFALTPPFAFYAVALYPEVPAALATAAFLLLSRRDPGSRGAILAGVIAAGLPWLHPRLLPLAALGLALTLARRCAWRARAASAALFVASLSALLIFFHSLYGQASITAAYGPGFSADVSPARAPWGAAGLVFDRQFGLLAIAPVFVLALAGGAALLRWRPGDAMRAALFAGATLLAGASFSMWWGGACPPARFLVPALPALALALAPALRARRDAAAALGGIGLAIVALAADAPRALHNRADGESALLRVLAPAVDLDGALPSFVLGGPQAPLLALSLAAAASLALWRGGRGLALGALGYAAVAAGLRTQPLIDRRLATLDLLEAWEPGRLAGPMGPPALADLQVPLDLRRPPWLLRALEMQTSRRIDVPPGLYRLEVAARPVWAEPSARAARIDVVAGDLELGSAWVQAGQAAPVIPLLLPAGARRLALVASGVQGTTLVEEARLVPRELVPRSRRGDFAWPRVPTPDRYRVGDGAVRTTCLDRSEPEGEGFRLHGQEGAFLVESPRGSEVVARVVRPRPSASDVLLWETRRVPLGTGAEVEVRLPADGSVTLGDAVVVPARVSAYGAWITFSGAVGGTRATDARSASPEARPMVTVTSPPPDSGKWYGWRIWNGPAIGYAVQRGSLQKVRSPT
jgi:hypothetical protein